MKDLIIQLKLGLVDLLSAGLRGVNAQMERTTAKTETLGRALDETTSGVGREAGLDRMAKALAENAEMFHRIGQKSGLSNDEIKQVLKSMDRGEMETRDWSRAIRALGTDIVETSQGWKKLDQGAKDAAKSHARFARGGDLVKAGLKGIGDALDDTQRRMEQFENLGAVGDKLSGFGRGMMAPFGKAVKDANAEQSLMLDIGITADLDDKGVAALGKRLRDQARISGVVTAAAAGAVGQWVGQSGDLKQAEAVLPTILRASRATGAEVEATGRSAYALVAGLKIPVDQVGQALNVMIAAGKQGGVEFDQMSGFLSSLVSQADQLGINGVKGAATLGAAFQVAQSKGQDASEAFNNLKNLLSAIGGPELEKRFKDVDGIDLQAELKVGRIAGKDDLETVLALMDRLTGEQKARFGDIFGDAQARAGVIELTNGYQKFKDIRDSAMKAQDVALQDAARRSDDPTVKLAAIGASMDRISAAFGRALVPALNFALPLVEKFATWMEGVADGPAGAWIGGFALGIGVLASALGGAISGIITIGGGFLLLKNIAPGVAVTLSGLVRSLTIAPVMGIWNAARGLIGGTLNILVAGARIAGPAIGSLAGWIVRLGGGLIGMAVRALPMVLTGIRVLGMALISNPIGLVIAGIALGATLIIANWGTIGPFMAKLWGDVTQWAGGAWDKITGGMTAAKDSIMEKWAEVTGFFSSMWTGIKEGLGTFDWGMFIKGLDWKMFVPGIGWALLAGELLWNKVIKPLGWDRFIPKVNWGSFMPSSWASVLPKWSWSSIIPALPAMRMAVTAVPTIAPTVAATAAPGLLTRRASGGSFGRGPLLVGERGPELAYANRAGYIANHSQLAEMAELGERIRGSRAGGGSGSASQLRANTGGTGSTRPSLTFGDIHVHAGQGQNPQEIARMVMAEIERMMGQSQRGALHDFAEA